MKHRDFDKDEFNCYALALGKFTLAWNDLHLSLSLLFQSLLNVSNGLITSEIWNSITNDQTQRKMIMALVDKEMLGMNISNAVREEIKFILKNANKLEYSRNNYIHVPVVLANDKVIPFGGPLGNKRASDLEKKTRFYR